MKNKTTLVLLLILVLGVWGVIGFKIIAAFSGSSDSVENNNQLTASNKPITMVTRPKFLINIPNRDPFLGKIKSAPKKSTPSTTKAIKKPVKQWPNIVFKGVVSDKNSKKKIFLIEVNGTAHLVEVGNPLIEGLRFTKGWNEKVKLTFEGDSKMFELKENAFSY